LRRQQSKREQVRSGPACNQNRKQQPSVERTGEQGLQPKHQHGRAARRNQALPADQDLFPRGIADGALDERGADRPGQQAAQQHCRRHRSDAPLRGKRRDKQQNQSACRDDEEMLAR
jgi:hypothetical protein